MNSMVWILIIISVVLLIIACLFRCFDHIFKEVFFLNKEGGVVVALNHPLMAMLSFGEFATFSLFKLD